MNNGSRLKYLSVLVMLGMLAGLWLSARDGDLLSALVLAVFAALMLVSLGLVAALMIMYVVSRINRPAAESIRDMADAQRSMAGAMATWGRAANQLPAGSAAMLPGGQEPYPGERLVLPGLTRFQGVEEVDDGQEAL